MKKCSESLICVRFSLWLRSFWRFANPSCLLSQFGQSVLLQNPCQGADGVSVCACNASFVMELIGSNLDWTAKEHVIGWYSTGPKLRENDLDIHELFRE